MHGAIKTSVEDPDSDPPDPMFLGLLDQDPDPLVRGMDPNPDPSTSNRNSEKNLDSYCSVTFFLLLIFEK
jgi:hypothetical protein